MRGRATCILLKLAYDIYLIVEPESDTERLSENAI